jgi:hypothetical protein
MRPRSSTNLFSNWTLCFIIALLCCSCGSSEVRSPSEPSTTPKSADVNTSSAFCAVVPSDFLSGQGRPVDKPFTEAEIGEDRAELSRMVENAPSDIESDLSAIQASQEAYFDLLARYDYDPVALLRGATPEEQATLDRVLDGNQPHWTRLIDYLRNNCSNVSISPEVPG